jgi:hypothetical protein
MGHMSHYQKNNKKLLFHIKKIKYILIKKIKGGWSPQLGLGVADLG